MLVGATTDPERLADDLTRLASILPNALIVVSSDLSHYHCREEARRLDQTFLEAVVAEDLAAAGRGEACGLTAIRTLMHVAHHFGWQPSLLAYSNSGDMCGTRDAVVDYGAVAYAAPPEATV